jgi:hypothetical protein
MANSGLLPSHWLESAYLGSRVLQHLLSHEESVAWNLSCRKCLISCGIGGLFPDFHTADHVRHVFHSSVVQRLYCDETRYWTSYREGWVCEAVLLKESRFVPGWSSSPWLEGSCTSAGWVCPLTPDTPFSSTMILTYTLVYALCVSWEATNLALQGLLILPTSAIHGSSITPSLPTYLKSVEFDCKQCTSEHNLQDYQERSGSDKPTGYVFCYHWCLNNKTFFVNVLFRLWTCCSFWLNRFGIFALYLHDSFWILRIIRTRGDPFHLKY